MLQTGAPLPGGGGLSRNSGSGSCTVTPFLHGAPLIDRGAESTQQSVYDGAHLEQLRAGGECCGVIGRLGARVQIGPRGRYQRACAIREDEHELQLSAPLHTSEDFQRPPFQRVAAPDDHHTFGIAIVMVVMGSLSGGLSIR
jgi:hypothetical protein